MTILTYKERHFKMLALVKIIKRGVCYDKTPKTHSNKKRFYVD